MSQKLPARLHRGKNDRWYVVYTENGRSQRASLRTTDLQVAEARFEGWRKQRDLDIVVHENPTIEYCLDLWMEGWVKDRMITQDRYPSIVKNLNAYFGKMPVYDVKREHSKAYYELRSTGTIGRSKATNSTIRLELQRLRAALRFMAERVEPTELRLQQDKLPYIELPHASPPRNRVLSEEEVQLLRSTCSNMVINGQGRRRSNRMARIARFVMMALETAQRKSAITELKWNQVMFDRNIIQFNPEGRLQTQKKRPTIPISPVLRPVLERAKEEAINDFVLDHTGGVYEPLKKLGKDLGIDGLHPHVFRHTWATRAVMRGVSFDKVAMFLGDREKTVRENYAHLAPDYLADVFE